MLADTQCTYRPIRCLWGFICRPTRVPGNSNKVDHKMLYVICCNILWRIINSITEWKMHSAFNLIKVLLSRNVAGTQNCMCHWCNFMCLTSNPDSPENLGQDDIQHSLFGQDPVVPKCGWNTIIAVACATDEILIFWLQIQTLLKI
jgi:hypothetical protein